eukprot:TRINITY_DN12024_c0_g1_i2.p1 TRINITY_DN12024_c0_g1~~TRINITY_DN12024_c0_g1_i2.p1  ORF type:complete len:486 (+),score=88.17 TRINITY_DN12024_c0_g1_i2:119-1576(+)
MAVAGLRHGIALWCGKPVSSLPATWQHRAVRCSPWKPQPLVTFAAAANENKEYVIIGGGNAAGYAARAFVENGVADGKLCIVSNEKVPPYERPALTKAYLFPLDKSPARLPGFHTCVGGGGERQTTDWYTSNGIEVLYNTSVTGLDVNARKLTTSSGETIEYGEALIIATGSTASRLPESIGGGLPGVHYIRNVADADSLISSLQSAKKIVVIGGGYIGMEVAAATSAWKLDTTVVFPDAHLMARLFTPTIAKHYEDFYKNNGTNFVKGKSVKKLIAGDNGRVAEVELSDGSTLSADLVVVGIGAKPAAGPFLEAGLLSEGGAIQVDGVFGTSVPSIFAIGDVVSFPLKIYGRVARVEHVDHARKSAAHCVNSLLQKRSDPYDYLPYFYSRVFEHPGSDRKIFWQFHGDNVGETIEVGGFDPKYAAFWYDSGRVQGVFLESGSPEEFALLPSIAKRQPAIDRNLLQQASSVEEALSLINAVATAV